MLLTCLIDVCNKIDLQIEWVRGHSDVTGNEYADVLAKGGTEINLGQCNSLHAGIEAGREKSN